MHSTTATDDIDQQTKLAATSLGLRGLESAHNAFLE